jgi:hypothetical protein
MTRTSADQLSPSPAIDAGRSLWDAIKDWSPRGLRNFVEGSMHILNLSA